MTPDDLPGDDGAGRRRRARTIVAVGAFLVLPLGAYGWYADQRADARAASLADDIRGAADEVADVRALAVEEQVFWSVGTASGPSPLESALGRDLDIASTGLDPREIRAALRTGWGGSDRCVHLRLRVGDVRTDVRDGSC
jgi:hypothetical protein